MARLRELIALERQDIAAVIAYGIGALFQPLVVLTLVLFVFVSL